MNIFKNLILGALIVLSTFTIAQAQEDFDFTGIGVGVTLNTFNGETPQNLQKGWALEVTPIFKVANSIYIAPNFNYSRQYQTVGGGLNGYYRLGSSENYKIYFGATTIIGEAAISPDNSSGVQYNNLFTGGLEFVIQWKNFYGISPTFVFNQQWTKVVTDEATLVPKPKRETSISLGVVFGANKEVPVVAYEQTLVNR